MNVIQLKNGLRISNQDPLVLLAGMNVLESRDLALRIAEEMKRVTDRLGVPYVFKASFDKANRSSIHSYRGPGLEEGLAILCEVRDTFQVPVLTDVHEPHQAKAVAEVCEILQLPAFLCRQTDLVVALAESGAVIQVKKGQFLAPEDMRHVVQKLGEAGNEKVILCERGAAFGYHNLVVDMLGFDIMKALGVPVTFDVTHALQLPGGRESSSGGRRTASLQLAKAGVSQGIAGLFLEAHPNPDEAKCDGPSALPLSAFAAFVEQIQGLDHWVKSQTTVDLQ